MVRAVVGVLDEVLADDVIDANPPAIKQMIDVFHRVGGPVESFPAVYPALEDGAQRKPSWPASTAGVCI